MNLFKELWSKAKDTLKEAKRESLLKAQYKTHLAKKEEELAKEEANLNDKVLSESYTFSNIADSFEAIEILKSEIELAKEAYEYIFTEKKTK